MQMLIATTTLLLFSGIALACVAGIVTTAVLSLRPPVPAQTGREGLSASA